MRTLVMLFIVSILIISCGGKVSPQQEPRLAIEGIKAAYDSHLQKFGSTENYTIDEAVVDARIDDDVLDRWKFYAHGVPPTTYLAKSRADHPSGSGKRVVYDVAKGEFEGWMVNNHDEDDE
ncbi:MAG: hypothetical protein K8R90_03050 [Candidatus Cloacimonetes bacterium]|nr:hypothetical protein [Candidatus Cloacimonadota bacterium]